LASASEESLPFVTVIVPCRNEAQFIGQCLDSIIRNGYPPDRLEVLVVDGMSEDGTRAVVASLGRRYPFVRLVDNPKKSIPAAMNTGIRCAKGDVIIKMDAHSTYQPDHISACVRHQKQYGAENVGGVWKMLPGAETKTAKAIVLALAHPFGSGNAYIKVGVDKPTWSDTAAFGCYRKELFDKVGPFNEKLRGSSDLDMNARIQLHGGRILLVPDIVITYYADASWRSFWKHNFADGVWATYVVKFGSKGWAWRHWVPLAFVSSLIGSAILAFFLPTLWWPFLVIAGSYAMANLAASVQISIRERKREYLPTLPLAFAVRHMAHGLGALLGLLLVLVPGEHWKGRRRAKA